MAEKITRSDAEWRGMLDPETYRVTRQAGTERPFSHQGFPKGPGHYVCACCGARLFDGDQKFESHCGWPSFSRAGGEIAVERPRVRWKILDAWQSAAAQQGIDPIEEFNRGDNAGSAYFHVNGQTLRVGGVQVAADGAGWVRGER